MSKEPALNQMLRFYAAQQRIDAELQGQRNAAAGVKESLTEALLIFFVLSARYFPPQLADGNSNSSNAKQLKQWLSGTPGYAVFLGGAA